MIWNLHIVPTDIYVSYLCFILLAYHTRIVEISNLPTYSDDPNKSSELFRGVGTEPEFRGFSTEKFLTSWIYEGGNFLCFTGKKLVPTPLELLLLFLGNFFQQNRLIWVWTIINFSLVCSTELLFRTEFWIFYLFIKKKLEFFLKKSENIPTEVMIWIIISFEKSPSRTIIQTELLFGLSEY